MCMYSGLDTPSLQTGRSEIVELGINRLHSQVGIGYHATILDGGGISNSRCTVPNTYEAAFVQS